MLKRRKIILPRYHSSWYKPTLRHLQCPPMITVGSPFLPTCQKDVQQTAPGPAAIAVFAASHQPPALWKETLQSLFPFTSFFLLLIIAKDRKKVNRIFLYQAYNFINKNPFFSSNLFFCFQIFLREKLFFDKNPVQNPKKGFYPWKKVIFII